MMFECINPSLQIVDVQPLSILLSVTQRSSVLYSSLVFENKATHKINRNWPVHAFILYRKKYKTEFSLKKKTCYIKSRRNHVR